jgi:pimeloyl-ACP methyl ester carboxylesterase
MQGLAQPTSLEAGGLRLAGLTWPAAEPDAPVVLLLHATSFCGAAWDPVLRAARDAGAFKASALAPDARGHGASDAPADPSAYAWTRLVDDVIAWIDEAERVVPNARGGAAGVVLVGHSCGATTALVAAARRSGCVRGVLAIEPVLFDVPPMGADVDSYGGSRFMATQARRRRASFADVDEARTRLAARPPYAGFAKDALEAFLGGGLVKRDEGGVALRCAPEVEAACYDGAASLDIWPELERILCPVRLVAGERSFMPPALVERLRQRIPGTTVESIEGGTHFVALEQPAAVGAALARFLREVTPIHVA